MSIVLTPSFNIAFVYVCSLAVYHNDDRKHTKTQAESNTVHSSEEDQSEADQQVLSAIVSESDLLLNVHYDVKGASSYDVMNSMVMKSSSTGTADEQLVHARNTGNASACIQSCAFAMRTHEVFRWY
jgi:hypothetical protein